MQRVEASCGTGDLAIQTGCLKERTLQLEVGQYKYPRVLEPGNGHFKAPPVCLDRRDTLLPACCYTLPRGGCWHRLLDTWQAFPINNHQSISTPNCALTPQVHPQDKITV